MSRLGRLGVRRLAVLGAVVGLGGGVASAGLLAVTVSPAAAATDHWTGGGTDSNWSTAANWDAPPVPGDDLVFPPVLTGLGNINDLPSGNTFNSLTLSGTGYTISGNAIGLAGGVTSNVASGSNSVNLPISLGATAAGVDVENSTNTLNLGGALSGSGGLRKTGSGTLGLEANDNSLTGTLMVSGGTLLVDGTAAGSVAVSSGTTLGGRGIVGGISTTSGTVAPGEGPNQPEILTVTGATTLDSGSTFQVALDGTTAGSGYSQLAPSAPVDLAGAALDVNVGFTSKTGDTFDILHSTSGAPVTGTFASLPQGSTLTANGRTFQIDYSGGPSGDDVTLTDVTSTATPTTTTVTSSANPSVVGQPVTFTANVTSTAGTPTGSVQFTVDGSDLGTPVALSAGAATSPPLATLTAGPHAVAANYSPSASSSFGTSSGDLTQQLTGCAPGQASHLLTAKTNAGQIYGLFCVNRLGVGTYTQGSVSGKGVVVRGFGVTVISAPGANPDLDGLSFGPINVFTERAPLQANGTFSLS